MAKKLLKSGIMIAIFAALMTAAPLVFGQSASVNQEINDLNLKIQNQKKQLQDIQAKQQQYEAQIQAKQKEKATLSNQISLLSDSLAKTQLEIDGANLEIDKTSLEIKKIELDSASLDAQIEKQKDHIADLLQLIYKQGQVSTLEMLLMHSSLTDFLNQVKYLSDTNKEVVNSVDDLKNNKAALEDNKAALNQKNKELLALKAKLSDKKSGLAYDQQSKNYLLEQTRSSERQFQNLLTEAQRQQAQAEAEISATESLLRQKMSQQDRNRLNSGNNTIDWPVPKNIIIATFHDPDYPYRRIIGEHPAVDIRAKQGTTITAAADGYVAKVKFDGTKNYAYIMLIHGNGLATVYGHVSAVYVLPDQYVTQGQPIGRTGGTPGSVGAGPFTTGPHLHFEVRLNGLPVDPQSYLP